jgi:hypothetical protein
MRSIGIGVVLALGALTPAQVHAQNAAVSVNVDATASRHAIDPRIYGVAFGTSAALSDLNVPLNRQGGNAASRHNWSVNASNRAADWYFESIDDGSATPGAMGDSFISDSRAGGAQPLITIPMVGWVAKLAAGRNKLASFSIAKYGAQQGSDWQWFPDAGNGVLTNGAFVSNDMNDANVPADATFQLGWVQHLIGTWGTAANGGLRYYLLDNEHSIWHSTHRDVHPVGATMEEIRDKMLQYSSMIKGADPSALVLGPEEWGWSGYLLSGYDQQWGSQNGWANLPDRTAHGNMDYLPWLLDQLRQRESAGTRALDVFSVHYYPQGGEFSDDVSTATQLLRNRSTRSLWDPNYVDETWIADTVQLIPRLRSWATTYYHADTKIGVTEYNWGAEGNMNGATAQADVLGIFGREGLDLATRWEMPSAGTPVYLAMKMYRNYDGAKSTFGDTSVSTTGPNPDQLAAFGAVRTADGALTLMVVNKALTGNTPVTVSLAHFAAASAAHVWQLSAGAIQALADLPVTSGSLTLTAPPQSLTLLVIPSSGAPRPTATPTATATATATATGTPTPRPTPIPSGTPGGRDISDFDHDGQSDLLMQYQDGRVGVWFMSGTSVRASQYIYNQPLAGWSVRGVGDLNGDGSTDIVWQYQDGSVGLWLMNGPARTSAQYIYNQPLAGWTIRGVADLNHDNHPDFIWQDSAGRVGLWLMNGVAIGSTQYIDDQPQTGWTIRATGDFDGDGNVDLLWQYQDGSVGVWFMNGTSVRAKQYIYAQPIPGWTIRGTGDFNGDGKTDIVWQDSAGRVAVWLMDGVTISGYATVYGQPLAGWTVAAAK